MTIEEAIDLLDNLVKRETGKDLRRYEFIEGKPLDQELIEGDPWEEDRVIALLKDILEVLAFVHKENIIHRDIHPQNLIRRTSNNKIVLIDFGAVKEINTSQNSAV